MVNRSTGSDIVRTRIIPGSACAPFPHRNKTLISRRHASVSTDMISSALSGRLGRTAQKIRPLNEGKGSCLFIIHDSEDRRLVVKIGLFGDHHAIVQEALFTAIVASCTGDIPVPATYVLDLSGGIIPWPYSILEWLPGKSILNIVSKGPVTDIQRYFGRIGNCIRLIHDITLPTRGYGDQTQECLDAFTATGTVPNPLRGSTKRASERYVLPGRTTAQALFESSVITERDHAALMSLLNGEMPECSERVILHGDMSMGNFLVHRNRLTGVLDGTAATGCRLEELADAQVFLCALKRHFPSFSADEAFRAFLGGYGLDSETITHDREYRFFLILKLIGHIGTLFEAKRVKQIPYFVALLREYV